MAAILLSIVLFTGLFVVLGHRIGKSLFPTDSRGVSTTIGALVALACFSITGAAVYYTTAVNSISLGVVATLTIGAIVLGTRKINPLQLPLRKGEGQYNIRSIVLFVIAGISLASWWQAVLSTPITDAVRSPWLVLSPIAIIAPAIAIVTSLVLLHRGSKTLGSISLFAALFSVFASSTFLFPLGYGFDPFLHRATLSHIVEHGTITPKPLYYIGEYALELFGNILGGIPIFVLDSFLVPLIAAITLTLAARKLPIGIAIFLIALGNFISTTPQSLAYLFTILTIISIPKSIERYRDLIAPSVFAIAALITHPIAGVPACFFVLFCTTRLWEPSPARTLSRWILGIFASLALPAMFAVQAMMSHASVSFSFTRIWKLSELPLTGFLFSQGNTWFDALYLVINNLSTIIIILAIIGLILQRRSRITSSHDSGILMICLLASFVIVSLGIDFSYLIDYERQDFALRLLLLATLFALPSADYAIAIFSSTLQEGHRSRLAAGLIALFIVSSASIYALYPRHDSYARSAAFNVSQADFNTVYAIHNREAEDADYIVLSNQATAAAALQEFGFRKYYHNDIFYYPIPTGGKLYQSYLSMVNDSPTRDVVLDAMQLAGVHKAYFVVSDYWWKSDAIIENAKQQTDEWFAVDGGKTTVFIFTDDVVAQ